MTLLEFVEAEKKNPNLWWDLDSAQHRRLFWQAMWLIETLVSDNPTKVNTDIAKQVVEARKG